MRGRKKTGNEETDRIGLDRMIDTETRKTNRRIDSTAQRLREGGRERASQRTEQQIDRQKAQDRIER